MAQELSRPSWSERICSVKGVLALLCFMIVAFCVVMVTDRSHNNICSSVSVTLYVASGILFKGFPGDSPYLIQIVVDDSVLSDYMPREKEFFLSQAEIGAGKFSAIEKRHLWLGLAHFAGFKKTERIKFGFWTKTSVGDNAEWYPMWSDMKFRGHPRLSGFDSNTTLTLSYRYTPSHDNATVSLRTSDSFGNLADWNLPLTTDPITGRASVVKDSSGSENSAHFDSIFNAVRNRTPIFAWSKWGGSVEFPILVNAERYASDLERYSSRHSL
eukprot:841313_1